jgi:aryl-alcohol dehydrogenase-like predicted oxidoreductase
MKFRPLGTTGITVSEIGLGAWQLANPAWGSHDPGEALRIVRQALDDGCDFFDTAPGYTGGLSEELLGEALKPARSHVSICTKFGHNANGSSNFDTAAIRPALEMSLRRLQTDYVDVYLLHNPPAHVMDGTQTSIYDELERLKTEGKLRAYGVSLDSLHELETVIETTRCKVVEVLFNAFHQDPLAAFRLAKIRGLGLVAKVPLDSGWLSGKYRKESSFDGIRSRWSPAVIERRAALVEQLAALLPPGVSMAHAALQYILAQPEISTVIPGAKSAEQARDNFAAGTGALTAQTARSIHSLWERELRDHPLPW